MTGVQTCALPISIQTFGEVETSDLHLGIEEPIIIAPVAGTTQSRGEATPGLMRSDSLITAVLVFVRRAEGHSSDDLTREGSFSRSPNLVVFRNRPGSVQLLLYSRNQFR